MGPAATARARTHCPRAAAGTPAPRGGERCLPRSATAPRASTAARRDLARSRRRGQPPQPPPPPPPPLPPPPPPQELDDELEEPDDPMRPGLLALRIMRALTRSMPPPIAMPPPERWKATMTRNET